MYETRKKRKERYKSEMSLGTPRKSRRRTEAENT